MTLRSALLNAAFAALDRAADLRTFAGRCRDNELRHAVLTAATRHDASARAIRAHADSLTPETLDAKVGDA